MTAFPDPDATQPARGPQYTAGPPQLGGPPVEALAGFGARLVGAIIDGVLLSAVGFVISIPFGIAAFNMDSPGAAVGSNGLNTLLNIAYFTYFHATAAGQSVGNLAMSIRVVDADTGIPIPVSRSLIRALMSIVSAIPCGLGYLWMLWDPRNQTWHDKVANTLVVKTSAYPAPAPFGRLPSS